MTIEKNLWTSKELNEIFGSALIDAGYVSDVSIDTRSLAEGDLFVALRGPHFNANDFLEEANQKGALYFIADESDKVPDHLRSRTIFVQDSLKALQTLAKASRARTKAKVVGITGSVGKTSTKNLVKTVLAPEALTYGSIGNFNNDIGLPLNLARLPRNAEIAILEMGMNHKGEIDFLSNLAQPDVAIITNVEAVHLEFFESVEGIAEAKAEIFQGMKKGGFAILNIDNPYYLLLEKRAMEKGLVIKTFGTSHLADAYLMQANVLPDKTEIVLKVEQTTYTYDFFIPGAHLILNSLAALLALKVLGFGISNGIKALEKVLPSEGRGMQIQLPGNIIVIDDCYNAGPVSMRGSLSHFSLVPGKRHIAILGDMLELGDQGPKLHRDLLEVITAKINRIYCCGSLMKELYEVLPDAQKGCHRETVEELWEMIQNDLQEGDIILLKGSAGMRLKVLREKLIQFVKMTYNQDGHTHVSTSTPKVATRHVL